MLQDFFSRQLDYISFCHGLAFVLLAAVCQVLSRSSRRPLPWGMLGAFGLIRGLAEWITLFRYSLGDNRFLSIFWLVLLTTSFIFLLEFARLSLNTWRGRGPGRWIVLALVAAAGAGGLGGQKSLEISLRLGLGVSAALVAAYALWLAAASEEAGAGWGKGAAWGMAGYAVASAFSVPSELFLPTSLANHETAATVLGIFLQVVQAGLAGWILTTLWLWARSIFPGEMDSYTMEVRKRLTWTMTAAVVVLLAVGWVMTQFLGSQAAREGQTSTKHYLRQFQQLVTAEMEGTRSIAQAMAGSPLILQVFRKGDGQSLQAANSVLDRYSEAFSGAVCYLMDSRGITLASSNRHQPDSFVGKSYVFRPYFQQAITGEFGRYLALGATSKERGFYASSPVRNPQGKIEGVAVIKRSIDNIESMLSTETLAFLIDPHGVIFLSSRPEMVLKSLWPWQEATRQEVITSRQFGSGPFRPILTQEPQDGRQVILRGKKLFVLRQPAALRGWSVVVLGSMQNVAIYRLIGIGAALFLCFTSLGLFMVWDTTLEGAARLGASQRIYRTLVEGAPDWVCLFDQDGHFLAINGKGMADLGLLENEVIGQNFVKIWPDAYQDLAAQAVHQAGHGEMAAFEGEYCRPDGRKMICHIILNPIIESDMPVRRVVGIATDITERKRAEADLQYRLEFEALITRISTDFINLRSDEIDGGIARALRIVGQFAGADRAYVFQTHDSGRLASNTFEWCAPGITAQREYLQGLVLDEELPWFAEKIRKLEVFHVPRVSDLPFEAEAEKQEFSREDIQSLVVVPMVQRETLVGFLGFDSVRQEKSWKEDTIILLKMVGDILVNALARQQAEEALHFDESRLEALVALGQMQEAPIQEITIFAMEEGVRLTRSRIGYLAFMSEDETVLTMYAWSKEALKECSVPDRTYVYPVESTGLWGEAVRQRRPVITNDYEAPNLYKRGYPEGHVPIKRHLNVPILEGGRIVAVAGVGNKEEPYDEADVRQLTLLMDGMWKLVQRRRAEEVLAAEKERLAVTLSSIGDAVIATDMEGRINLMNHVAEEMTGWSQTEAIGRPVAEVFRIVNEETREVCDSPVDRIIQTGEAVGLVNHTVLIAKDGRERLIGDSGAPIVDRNNKVVGVVLVFRDVTFSKKMEVELLKMEKLRSLGILAGGIAHDFNNILTGILGNISLALLYAGKNGELTERLMEAEKASFRARDLVQQLLTFAKGGAPVKKLASLKEMVEESAGFAIRGSQVRCEFDLPEDLWPVEVDEGQISQVVQNLVINAVQAMPTGGGITIKAANRLLTAPAALPLPAGPYVEISLEDQGIGIPADYLPRIFDPYFSTKQQGSGLGLATVYSIIKNHDGYITVSSNLGKGTVFTFLLPASPKMAIPSRDGQDELYPGQGRVLLMDDEVMVREIAGRILEHLGYEVSLARDGAEAVEMYAQAMAEGRPFKVVVLDLTVPGGMGGRETMEKLRALDPAVKALVSSGYAEDAVMTRYRDHGFAGVVQKPYKVGDISVALHNLLEGEAAAARRPPKTTTL